MDGDTKSRSCRARRPKEGVASEQARNHLKTRTAHETETAQDYVEAMADLIDEHGTARIVDLARRMGVSHVTVIRSVARLQARGLVRTKPYRGIELTRLGATLAQEVRHRHRVTVAFLQTLGVSARTARRDAEGIEHHLSTETLAAFESFVRTATARRRR
jgi:DtxR family manganese transport transcriptional regulator